METCRTRRPGEKVFKGLKARDTTAQASEVKRAPPWSSNNHRLFDRLVPHLQPDDRVEPAQIVIRVRRRRSKEMPSTGGQGIRNRKNLLGLTIFVEKGLAAPTIFVHGPVTLMAVSSVPVLGHETTA